MYIHIIKCPHLTGAKEGGACRWLLRISVTTIELHDFIYKHITGKSPVCYVDADVL